MIKVVLIGGSDVETVAVNLEKDPNIKIVKQFMYASDFFNYLLGSSETLVNFDKIMLLPHGLREADQIEQMVNLQEALLVEEKIQPILYMIFNDEKIYSEFDNRRDELIKYDRAMALFIMRFTYKEIINVIMGRYDSKAIRSKDMGFVTGYEEEDELQETSNSDEDDPKGDSDNSEGNEEDDEFDGDDDEDSESGRKRFRIGGIGKTLMSAIGLGGKYKTKEDDEDDEDIDEDGEIPSEPQPKASQRIQQRPQQTRKNPSKVTSSTAPSPQRPSQPASSAPARAGKLRQGALLVTGERQSGVSSYAANLASLLSHQGSTLILDFDWKRRGISKLFVDYVSRTVDSRQTRGLWACLNNPRLFEDAVIEINDSLFLLTITEPYSSLNSSRALEIEIGDKRREELLNAQYMYNLISFVKPHFDYVVIDMPLEALQIAPDAATYSEYVLLCSPNTSSALNNLFFVELADILNKTDAGFTSILSKSRIILSKYLKESTFENQEITPKKTMDLLQSENQALTIPVIAATPFTPHWEKQWDNNQLLVDTGWRRHFEDILRNL